MAGKKMVSLRAKIREMLRLVKKEKGGFYLAMIAQSSPDLPDGWTLAISAPWTEGSGLKYTVRYFSAKLTEFLTKAELAAIDRISVLDGREPVVQGIQLRTNQRLDGSGQEEYEITNSAFGGVFIPDAFVFEADPYPDSPTGSVDQNRKTVGVGVR
jgi:hypothetical protein